jgi:hypothetical protein
MRIFLRFAVTVAGLGIAVISSNAAGQKPADKADKKKPAVAALAPIDVKPIVAKLKTGDEAQIKEALDEARLAGPTGAAAAPVVAEVLTRGLSLPLTQSAIETLGDLESDSGSLALSQYTSHRNAKVRRAAVKALTRTKGVPASAALRRAR